MKRTFILAASLLALAACGSKPTTSDVQPTTKPGVVNRPQVAVQTEPLRRMPLQGTVSATGQVVADAGGQATLAFPTDGQIATVNVNVGDRVSAGEVLASLDSRIASSAIEQARADVAAAQANLAKAQARARPQEFAQNSAQVQAAQAKAQASKAELDRQKALAHVGISSQRDLQQAQADYQSALTDLRVAQQQGSILQAGPRPQDVDVARSAVLQAQAALSAAQTKASLLNLVAPFDGIVTQRLKNPGETVDPTIPVIAMINPNRTVVDVQISQDQADLIRVGDAARVVVDGVARSISGGVIAVSPALDQETRTMTVRIKPAGGSLTPGAAAKATIVVRTVAGAFVVPDTAVVKDPETGNTVLYVARGKGRYRRVPVQIVLEAGNRTAIAATGLQPGESIVTQGAYELLPFAGGTSGD